MLFSVARAHYRNSVRNPTITTHIPSTRPREGPKTDTAKGIVLFVAMFKSDAGHVELAPSTGASKGAIGFCPFRPGSCNSLSHSLNKLAPKSKLLVHYSNHIPNKCGVPTCGKCVASVGQSTSRIKKLLADVHLESHTVSICGIVIGQSLNVKPDRTHLASGRFWPQRTYQTLRPPPNLNSLGLGTA